MVECGDTILVPVQTILGEPEQRGQASYRLHRLRSLQAAWAVDWSKSNQGNWMARAGIRAFRLFRVLSCSMVTLLLDRG